MNKNNINQNNTFNNFIPKTDQREEDRREFLINKNKNTATYSYLTHNMNQNLPKKTFREMTDEEKMRQYKESLDEQVKNKSITAYNKENKNIRESIPPAPCKLIYIIFLDSGRNNYSHNSNMPYNHLIPQQRNIPPNY